MNNTLFDLDPLPNEAERFTKIIEDLKCSGRKISEINWVAAGNGERQLLEHSLNQFRQYRNRFCKQFKIKDAPVLGITGEAVFNAAAGRINDDYVIFVNKGTILSLWNFFSALFGAGFDPYQFVEPLVGSTPRPDGVIRQRLRMYRNGLILGQSRNRRLAEAMSWLWSQACLWIFFHELAHFANGHLDIELDQTQIKMIHQIPQFDDEEKYNLDVQTLEFDADCVATQMVIEGGFSDPRIQDIANTIAPLFKEAGEAAGIMAAAYLPIISTFLILDDAWSYDTVYATDHPPAQIRIAHTTGMWYSLAPRIGINHDETANALVAVEAICINTMYKYFQYTPFMGENPLKPWTAQGNEHLQKLLKNWAILRPRLLPHHRGPNLAAVEEQFSKFQP